MAGWIREGWARYRQWPVAAQVAAVVVALVLLGAWWPSGARP